MSRRSQTLPVAVESDTDSEDSTRFNIGQEVWCEWNSIFYRAKINKVGIYLSEQYYRIHYWKFSKSWDMTVAESRLMEYTKESIKRVTKINRDRNRKKKTEVQLRKEILTEAQKRIVEQKPYLKLQRVDDRFFFSNGFGGNYNLGFPKGRRVRRIVKRSSKSSKNLSVRSKKTENARKLKPTPKKKKRTDDVQKPKVKDLYKYNKKKSDELYFVEDIPVGGHLQKLQMAMMAAASKTSNKRSLEPENNIAKKIKINAPKNNKEENNIAKKIKKNASKNNKEENIAKKIKTNASKNNKEENNIAKKIKKSASKKNKEVPKNKKEKTTSLLSNREKRIIARNTTKDIMRQEQDKLENDRIAKKLNATKNKKKLVKNKSNDSENDSMRKKSRYEINNDNIINTSRRQLKTTASVSLTENLRPTLKLQDINIDYEKNNSSSSSCELLEHNVLAREDSNDSKCSSAYNKSKNDRIAKKLNATRNKKKLVKNKSNDSVNDSIWKKSRE
ncbi:Hypothetical protein CINCED_3A020089 [Cinara cedri]|uniref:Tudor-knot domain-containing protein n=1 Tax=Cinara cedri TaxID=506608 RepID=A0A5E4N4I8_9HEMI|nr:Hypothetical protein CINCED_3A020089 [Cinara cedri]